MLDHYTHHVPPPCFEPVEVVFNDDDLLVVTKPAGLLSVPGRIVKDCVLNRMLVAFPGARIVHRLDLDTSGLLVLALTQRATSDLNRQFREKTIGKVYTALVEGLMVLDKGEITLPIAPDPDNRPRQVIDHDKGKSALTRFEVINRDGDSTRVRLFPVTGRSHQLRLHMKELGHPILGCDLYAPDEVFNKAARLCLHATSFSLDHPATGQRLTFDSVVPF